jgi:hypothetical protein
VAVTTVLQSGPRALRKKKDLEEALIALVELGHVQPLTLGRKKMIVVNPALLVGAVDTADTVGGAA